MEGLQLIIIIVAIYGAVLSTVALTWNIISYLFDKPKIVPKWSIAFIGLLENNPQHIFSIGFSNPTRHRVVISSAGISFKDKYDMHLIGAQDGFPKVLLQGDSHTIYRDIDIIKRGLDEHGSPNYIWVRDATGKTYKGSVKRMIGNVEAMYKSKHEAKKK